MMKQPVRSLLALLALVACGSPATVQVAPVVSSVPAAAVVAATGNAPVSHALWTRNATIYEINVRQYTPEGTFSALQRHLPRLDSLGADILWIMPVQPIGRARRKGLLGSPYSISDYRAMNPEYGTLADFRAFTDSAHARHKHVILDWVANHTAFDHKWITQHPDWYVHHADGTISNARDNEGRETDWTDVAELNYDNPDMRRAMIADMRFWVDSMHVDGFRCDVAGGVPMDFWIEARRELSLAQPDLFMLAEAEGPQYHVAFDMTYGWEFHHLLNEVAQGKQPVAVLDAYEERERHAYPADAYRMYFTSNHDENSWNGTEFERMGENNVPAFILAATFEGGMPLLYTGQEVGMKKRLRFFEKDTVDWSAPSLAAFYRAAFALKHQNVALANGDRGGEQVRLMTDGGSGVYAFSRTRANNTVVVAVNFAGAPAHVTYSALPHAGRFTDWFTKTPVTMPASGQLDIPAHGYRVLVQ